MNGNEGVDPGAASAPHQHFFVVQFLQVGFDVARWLPAGRGAAAHSVVAPVPVEPLPVFWPVAEVEPELVLVWPLPAVEPLVLVELPLDAGEAGAWEATGVPQLGFPDGDAPPAEPPDAALPPPVAPVLQAQLEVPPELPLEVPLEGPLEVPLEEPLEGPLEDEVVPPAVVEVPVVAHEFAVEPPEVWEVVATPVAER